jgi:GNAT superfamily N-acetyltransferase
MSGGVGEWTVSLVVDCYTRRMYIIRPFCSEDQTAACQLILDGLREHWGGLDPALNGDLDDIMSSYVDAGHAFFVVEEGGELIGTGALLGETAVISRIVRVSVRADQRGRGLGRAISQHLIAEARLRGCREILVETTDTWTAAIRLYQRCGFTPYAWRDGDIHMRKEIGD